MPCVFAALARLLLITAGVTKEAELVLAEVEREALRYESDAFRLLHGHRKLNLRGSELAERWKAVAGALRDVIARVRASGVSS